jgi:carboxyl-terminal processing protease
LVSSDPPAGGIVADGEKYTLSGAVTSPNGLLDMYIQVNDQKVFFKGASGDVSRLNFSSEFQLKEGNNNVLIVARETPEFVSRKALVIRRRPAAVAQKMLPTADLQPPPRQ